MRYMKQLDSLRAFAVIAVMIHHLIPLPAVRVLGLGSKGVDLFFVLSGFLITTILIKSKAGIDAQQTSIVACAKQFYIRRTLRIFPIYYLTLLLAVIFNVPPFRESALWHFSYLSNIYVAQIDKWPGAASHLWSLSVEEQFYLLWPWLIFLIPRNKLRITFIGLIVLALVSRITAAYIFHLSNIVITVITFSNLDFFAAGALLALSKTDSEQKLRRGLQFYAIVGSILYIGLEVLRIGGINTDSDFMNNTLAAALYMQIIDSAASEFKGVAGKMLEFKPLVYIGKISYGVYLYHNFSPHLTKSIFNFFSIPLPQNVMFIFIIYLILTIICATISWCVIERPFNLIKNRTGNVAGPINIIA